MEEDVLMTPIGVLTVEHLLIARMMDLIERKMGAIQGQTRPDMVFIDGFMDFAKTYADACHHGKEESIFFEKLARKNLLPEHKKIMDELVLEHIQARKIIANLELAREDFMKGDSGAAQKILTICKSVWQIYPGHMTKEEKVFFPPALEYFSKREQDEMVKSFWEFDKTLLLEKYIKFFDQYDR
jgi:hemerythrin-like domain-containing protein